MAGHRGDEAAQREEGVHAPAGRGGRVEAPRLDAQPGAPPCRQRLLARPAAQEGERLVARRRVRALLAAREDVRGDRIGGADRAQRFDVGADLARSGEREQRDIIAMRDTEVQAAFGEARLAVLAIREPYVLRPHAETLAEQAAQLAACSYVAATVTRKEKARSARALLGRKACMQLADLFGRRVQAGHHDLEFVSTEHRPAC